jgi:general L-amino acid transport system permease protein
MRGPGPSRKPSSSGAYATVWHEITSFVFDLRFIQVLGQIAVVIVLVTLVSRVVTDMLLALNQQGLTPNFDFFLNRSGFDVAEAPSWYSANSSYWEAFQVGLVNTLRVVSAGLIATTVLGVLVGIFLLSSNWLVRTISKVYVEILRNTPLLVQLFVWYFIVILSLPVLNDAVTLPQEGCCSCRSGWRCMPSR